MKIIRPTFWNKINLISLSLFPLTFITYLVNLIKNFSDKKKFSLKTICVGNIYVGGTGKTPLCIKINKILSKNYKTTFIKKKYTNQYDEQKLLSSNGNLICRKNRANCLKTAKKQNYDLGIMYDGLQDISINYDLSIVSLTVITIIQYYELGYYDLSSVTTPRD